MDKKLIKDLFVIAFSIVIAITLLKTGAVLILINSLNGFVWVASFFAGIFYTSIFTAAPASIAIIEMAQRTSPVLIAFTGAFGSLIWDYFIFKFIKENVSGHLITLSKKIRSETIMSSKIFTFFLSFIGAFCIATPLPDEIGLALMGISKMRTAYFIPISYSLNFIGILVLALIGRAI